MSIKPIQNITFRAAFVQIASNGENSVSDKMQRLSQLQCNLSAIQSALADNSHKKHEREMLASQIDDMLFQIENLKKSILRKEKSTNNQNNAENPIKSTNVGMMDFLMSTQSSKDIEISQLEKEGGALISAGSKFLNVMPFLGRDLVQMPQKLQQQKPKSFEDGDKKLLLDEYQKQAVDKFRKGNTVLVTAPTGTGKTLIAEHIIDDIIKSGKKVIYTTPLKALCNDKYKQFSKLWGDYDEKGELTGSSKVGLATGDVKINTDAPLVVMTTEIYRNMLLQKGENDIKKELKDVDAVVFDEFHYMGDNQRGSVWEEAVMFSPKHIKHLMLSATVSNANDLNNWMNEINKEHNSVIVNVPEEERHVPLKHFVYANLNNSLGLFDLTSEKINLDALKTKKLSKREKETLRELAAIFNTDDGISVFNNNISHVFDRYTHKADARVFINELVKNGVQYQKAEQYALRLSDTKSRKINPELISMQSMEEIPLPFLVRELTRKKMTPALYFVYSKKNCKKLMLETSDKVGQLLTKDEQREVASRIKNIQDKGIFLGVDFEDKIKPCLLNGIAMHHAGMLPQCRSFIEELGRNKLVKICFATDTLGAGINFPFKTVVFSDFEKYSDMGFEEISVNSFKQGAGRAGRRGIDSMGYVVSIPKQKDEAIIPYNKITQDADEIQSAFKLSYGLVLSPRFLNHSVDVLKNSFECFQTKTYDDALRKSLAMKKLLKSRKFVDEKNNILRLTEKGKIAAKARGINELLLGELLTNKELMENITPSTLAGIVSMFAPEKEDKIQSMTSAYPKIGQKLDSIVDMALNIREQEQDNGIDSNIMVNTSIFPFVKMWADVDSQNHEDNIVLWQTLYKDALTKDAINTEGDFLKKINYASDIMKQIQKVAPTQHIKDTAKRAVKLLQKSPVNDILLYELDYKVNE